MKGSECRLIEYMEGSKKRFIIPVYQRNYDWKIENCKQLFDDLVKIIKNNRKSHFFGSIVSVYEPSGRNTEFLVIDGQQRLTTVSLILLAMHNLISSNKVTPQDPSIGKQIYEDFLVDKYQPKETRVKLKPVKNDQNAFGKLFDSEKDFIRDSNLTTNYNYFCERIAKQEITVDELFDAICRLEIINITLSNDDNPQLIFESLNSTGLDLTEGDKIRNFILMGLPSKEQESYYDDYWNPIEVCTKYDVSSFVRDYLSIKLQAIPPQKKIYINFKDYVDSSRIKTESLMQELLAYAKRYEILLKGYQKDQEIDSCIKRLNRLETTVTRPFFLEVLRLFDENKLSLEQVKNIFLTTENYLFRRTICDLPTNALNKIFLMLHKEIVRYDGTDDNYVEKFKFALLNKKETARFPDDDEFITEFTQRQVYQMKSKNKIYILERFENFGTKEDKDVYRHCDDGIYTIEHIMPQTLSPIWQKALGEDFEQIKETWLHRIANLTLTAYNSKYSNEPFENKKTMKNGFLDSGIRMNTYIAQKEKWTLAEIEDRNDYLMKRALEIWASPITDFKPQVKELDSYTLSDDAELTGKSISKFVFRNTEIAVTSWVDMFQKVVQMLYSEDKSIITKLAACNDKDEKLASYFSFDDFNKNRSCEIGDGISVWTNTNTEVKINLLRQIFALYEVDTDDLVFYLKDDKAESYDEASRYSLRKRYWTYALDIINQVHGETGSYKNRNATKDNWLNGFIGISDFFLSCVAKFDSARVEFNMSKPSKETNQEAFDLLYSHKDEIEKSLQPLETELKWKRGDDIKTSKLYIEIKDVSIGKEEDWPRMAQFHAEWSKKFFDVIVPYLDKYK